MLEDAWRVFELVGGAPVQESAQREGLAVAQHQLGLRSTGGECGDGIAADLHGVGEVERADFGRDLQLDGAVGVDEGGELKLDAVLAELDGDGGESTCAALHDGEGELAAGEEVGLLSRSWR